MNYPNWANFSPIPVPMMFVLGERGHTLLGKAIDIVIGEYHVHNSFRTTLRKVLVVRSDFSAFGTVWSPSIPSDASPDTA